MSTNQGTVISRLRQDMKEAPVTVSSDVLQVHPTDVQMMHIKLMDGYIRVSAEQPIRLNRRAALRRRRIVTCTAICFVIIAAIIIFGMIVSARV